MNSRAYITLECAKENRFYQLLIPMGAPFKEVHQVIIELANDALAAEKLIEEQKKAAETAAQEKPVEAKDAS